MSAALSMSITFVFVYVSDANAMMHAAASFRFEGGEVRVVCGFFHSTRRVNVPRKRSCTQRVHLRVSSGE